MIDTVVGLGGNSGRETETVFSSTRSGGLVSREKVFRDEDHNVFYGRDAEKRLSVKNDRRFLQGDRGVTEVDLDRWEEAQRYERKLWIQGAGRRAREDRNTDHERGFNNYSTIWGQRFENSIEIGCGPFTNIVRVLRHVRSRNVTLLDPLIDDYLAHRHCPYRRGGLGGWFGKKVRLISEPLEDHAFDEDFDLVILVNVLEHCRSAPTVFRKLQALTAESGTLVFYDKLIGKDAVQELTATTYDAGHPLRVADDVILDFLYGNFEELYTSFTTVGFDGGESDAIYFIGRKRASA